MTSLKSLAIERIDGGALLACANAELQKVAFDAFNRRDLLKPRTLTLTVKIIPDKDGSRIYMDAAYRSSLPEQQASRTQIVKGDGEFKIYEQPTLFDTEADEPKLIMPDIDAESNIRTIKGA
jgi:hypothetical protein